MLENLETYSENAISCSRSCGYFHVLLCCYASVSFSSMQDMSQLEFLYLSNNNLDRIPTPLPLRLRVLHLQVEAHPCHGSSSFLPPKVNLVCSQVTRLVTQIKNNSTKSNNHCNTIKHSYGQKYIEDSKNESPS